MPTDEPRVLLPLLRLLPDSFVLDFFEDFDLEFLLDFLEFFLEEVCAVLTLDDLLRASMSGAANTKVAAHNRRMRNLIFFILKIRDVRRLRFTIG